MVRLDLQVLTAAPYQVVYSLGSNCLPATELHRVGLRKASGPLDWMYAPDVWGVIDLLNSDFNDFFERSHLEASGYNKASGCHQVLDRKYRMVSMHDFDAIQNTAGGLENLQAVREKLMRRATRMLDDMREMDRILFIRTDTTMQEAIELRKVLERKVHGTYGLLIVNHVKHVHAVKDLQFPLSSVSLLEIPYVNDEFKENTAIWTEVLSQIQMAV